jgi:hypothetical protein
MSKSPEEFNLDVVDPDFESYANFEPGCRFERGEHSLIVYDPTRLRRWIVRGVDTFDFGVVKMLVLEEKTKSKAWHTMMSVTKSDQDFSVSLYTPLGVNQDRTTTLQEMKYTVRDGKKREGHKIGYDEVFPKIIELPDRIDVCATAQGLLDAFLRGSFEAPPLVPRVQVPLFNNILRALLLK